MVERRVCFISDVDNCLWGRVADMCPKVNSHPLRSSFYRQSWGGEVTCRKSTVIFKLVISSLTGIILVILGTVNLQFQGIHFFPFLCCHFSELWQLMSWVWSGHRVDNFSTRCFGIYTTAHRI